MKEFHKAESDYRKLTLLIQWITAIVITILILIVVFNIILN